MPWSPRPLAVALAALVSACAHRPAPAPTQPTAPVSVARGQAVTAEQNLVAFARVYGYVRFFHPTNASADADWQQLAVSGVELVHDAPTLDAQIERLELLMHPYAPSLQLWAHDEPAPPDPAVPSRRQGLVYWQYQGFPGTPVSLFTPPYRKVRVHPDESWRRHFPETPSADTRVRTQISDELFVQLPVVLSREQAAHDTTDMAAPGPRERHDTARLEVRQAAIIEVWNVLRHFYPYQHELELDWDAMLVAALRDASDDHDPEDFRNTLRGLLEPLEDGHGFVGHSQQSACTLPLRIELVEGTPVVTGTREPEKFEVGDVITHIDGSPALAEIESIASRLSGTRQWREFRAAAWETTRAPMGHEVEIQLERNGQHHRIRTEAERFPVPINPRPPAIHSFDDGVFYVDLTRADWKAIEPRLPELAAAPGIVFDMRGYPVNNDPILDHLLDGPEDTLWMHVPRYVEPDGEVVGWHDLGWHRRPAEPHLDAPVTFLVSAEAISYAESMLSYVESHELGTLVGQASAGANGDIVRFDTLGGFFVIYSGMRVTRHDGSPFHRGGVRPDLEVHPTIAGLRAGRDEVLEAGLEIVREAMPEVEVTARR
ncbi:MAG: S41 family peptidase [Myxococcota bacterium]